MAAVEPVDNASAILKSTRLALKRAKARLRKTEADVRRLERPEPPRRLRVNWADFQHALRVLARIERAGSGLRFGFRNHEMRISRGVTTVGIPARGTWRGIAEISGKGVVAGLLCGGEVGAERTEITGTASGLWFGPVFVSCAWSFERPGAEPATE